MEDALIDRLAIYESAAGGIEVEENEPPLDCPKLGVIARNARIIDDQSIVQASAHVDDGLNQRKDFFAFNDQERVFRQRFMILTLVRGNRFHVHSFIHDLGAMKGAPLESSLS